MDLFTAVAVLVQFILVVIILGSLGIARHGLEGIQ
jgi:hypothetical protein